MPEVRPCLLMILDGWGVADAGPGNAVRSSCTPVLESLMGEFPVTTLACSGPDVGLPEGIMGNSEVGHLNLGAGRIVYQDLLRIDRSIEDQTFYGNPVLTGAMDAARDRGATCHFMGLLSDGGVHSRISHLKALISMAGKRGLSKIALHPILDGRDTPPMAGSAYLKDLMDFIAPMPQVFVSTLCGRFYAMDRDTRWERTSRAFDLYTQGEGSLRQDAVAAVEGAYASGVTDEFLEPVKIGKVQEGLIRNGDLVVFFNFRADRARQITRAFSDRDLDTFTRKSMPEVDWVCMTRYDASFDLKVAFGPQVLTDLLGEVVSAADFSQLRIAETEKYAHVTYFFNGGEERAFPGEERVLVPSPRDVETYDEKPEMSADLVADTFLEKFYSGSYALMVLNFANMDMVGHTGKMDAACRACEAVDRNVGRIVEIMRQNNVPVVITADHGNAEQMQDAEGKVHTAHTCNPVPLLLVDEKLKNCRLLPGRLGDVAPTVLEIMGLGIPAAMTGTSRIGKPETLAGR
ncbi:2,3-bisphosphoglycerate-independent phosphoglycerate mutase [Desulfobotulus mexicanus]|uniref:2,3-bisphosphoglycerate-independent phosphoglycerate mutase n=1 Tax=Desulfobotulus mexicanus TaxID=2586642 RepID=A0A5Q4VHD3_9BACT|nr:2,3-bisphosphoglycerate-independent phosphoglycerate mutase [Desulfobotulus mexicanus]TYT76328.1 2,3-bisphosphoglycerate-independent phosphoglycerate mutase [Desulfobotulus mexicanus]